VASYTYRGTDEQGNEHRGEIEAVGLADASALLRARGILPLAVDAKAPEEAPGRLVGVDAFTFFNRSLAEMTRLGFPLSRAVAEISRGLRRGRFKSALEGLEARLREGKSLHDAVAELPGEFPPHYRWMLQAGAAAGNLPAVLAAVARNTEGLRRARRAVVDALAYPAVILAFAALLIGGFLVFFLPVYRDLYRQYGLEPPITVRALLPLFGTTLVPASLAAGLVAGVLALRAVVKRTEMGERFGFRLPILGRIRRHLCMARLLGSLGVLLRARAPLVDALPVALAASGSLGLARASDRLRARAAEGAGIGDVLRDAPGVPPQVVAYLALAERSGTVPRAAEEVAELLTEQAMSESETLFLLLMPSALVVVGAVLATMFVSLVMPYLSFLERLGR
jgi:type II secretory pathway component PulF